MVEGAGPHTEFLAVIPHRKERRRFVETFAQDRQRLLRITKRNGIAKRLKAGDQLQGQSGFFRQIGLVKFAGLKAGSQKMRVVQNRVFDARLDQRGNQILLPDALRDPGSARRLAEALAQKIRLSLNLRHFLCMGNSRKDRLKEAAADVFHLALLSQFSKTLDELRTAFLQPFQQNSRVM